MRTRVNGSATETTTYAYDLNDRLVCKADPTGYTLCYDYDPVGNRTNFAVAPTAGGDSILSVSYTYDNRNRVSTITGNGRTTTFTYDAVGRRTGATWPNNSTATYTYDAAHQLLSLDHKTSGNADIATFAYAYDLAGNRTSMTTLEGVNSYTYNANNWLTGVTYPDGRTQEFTYDPVGNRLSLLDSGIGFQPVQYTYDNANRLLSSVSATETNVYSYDNAGRLTAQTVNGEPRTYSYDFRSQMTALTDTNAATGNYEFDGDGNRISGASQGHIPTFNNWR
jgi:YD repeat-containing protein